MQVTDYVKDFEKAAEHIQRPSSLTLNQHRLILKWAPLLGYQKIRVLENNAGCLILGQVQDADPWDVVGTSSHFSYCPPITPEGFSRLIPHLPLSWTYNFCPEFLSQVSGLPSNNPSFRTCRFHFPTRSVEDWWVSLKYNARRDLKQAASACPHLRLEVVTSDYPLLEMESVLLEYSGYLACRTNPFFGLQKHRLDLQLAADSGVAFLLYDGSRLVAYALGLLGGQELHFYGTVRRLGPYTGLRLGEYVLSEVASYCVREGLIFNASSDSLATTPRVFYKYKVLPRGTPCPSLVYEFGSPAE